MHPTSATATTAAPRPLRILTTVCNNPEYIRLQLLGFQRYVQHPFEFIVFNDAKSWPDSTNFGDPTMRSQIEETCRELGVRCIPVKNDNHRHQTSASHRHTDTLRAVMEFVRTEAARYWMIDSDMFLVDELSEMDIDALFAGAGSFVRQIRLQIEYAWPNLWWIDTTKQDTATLCWDLAPSCDTGGASAPWLSEHRNAVHWIHHLQSCAWDAGKLPPNLAWLRPFLDADTDRNQGNMYWCEIYDDRILHLRAGSNWNGEGRAVHVALSDRLRKILSAPSAQDPSQV